MKTRLMLFSLFISMASLTFFSNCSGKKDNGASDEGHAGHDMKEHPAAQTAEATKPHFEVDEEFRRQLQEVFTAYVDLKNALVESDAAQVKSEAQKVESALAKVDMKLLSGAAHHDWMTYLTPMQSSLKSIAASDDVGQQREAFSTLSENLYKSIKAFGLDGREAFYEYCPMAFDNEGAYWLSENDQIANPYFGDKMLTCGEVKERLQ